MDYLTNFFKFLDSLDANLIVFGLFLLFGIVAVIKIISLESRNNRLQEALDDQVDMHKVSIDRIADLESFLIHEKGLVSNWRNRCIELQDIISRKKQHRLRNGLFCTEQQYLDELNGVNVLAKTQEELDNAEINEEVNKQIEEYLNKK